MAEGVGVVGVPGAGLPPGFRGGEGRRHPVPVVEVVVGERLADGRHAGAMGQRVAQRDLRLACCTEFGPHVGDRLIERESTLADEFERKDRQQALAGRVDVDERVRLPLAGLFVVGPAAHEIDDGPAVDDHADTRADLTAFGEVGGECLAHLLETGSDEPFDRRWPFVHHPSLSAGPGRIEPGRSSPHRRADLTGRARALRRSRSGRHGGRG